MTKKFGTRSEVFDGLAEKTRGGLTKDMLILSRSGKIVSKKKSELAKANYAKFGFAKRAQPPPPAAEPVEEKPKRKRRRRKKKEEDVVA